MSPCCRTNRAERLEGDDDPERRKRAQVWVPGSLDTGEDLHPHVRRILGDPSDEWASSFARVYTLGDEVRPLLQGKLTSYPRDASAEARGAKALELRPNLSRRDRLERATGSEPAAALHLHLDDAKLVVFRTGRAVLLLAVSFSLSDGSGVHPCWIVEGLAALSRFNELAWRPEGAPARSDEEWKTAPAFSLGDIAYSLIETGKAARPSRRVFTATLLRFDEPLAAADGRRLAVQMARHYTDDYRLHDAPQGVRFVQDFENVLHAFALEGTASIIDTTPVDGLAPAPFLKHYGTQTFRRHYVPMILIAFHEWHEILALTQASAVVPVVDEKISIKTLEGLRDRILDYRLGFRFAQVSGISMHNAVNEALRDALGLDRMLEELDRDTAEIDSFLQHMRAQKQDILSRQRERRFRFATIAGAAAVYFLTLFTIGKEILEVTEKRYHWPTPDDLGAIAVLIGVIAGVGAGLIAYLREPKHDDDEENFEHAKHEIVIHASLKPPGDH